MFCFGTSPALNTRVHRFSVSDSWPLLDGGMVVGSQVVRYFSSRFTLPALIGTIVTNNIVIIYLIYNIIYIIKFGIKKSAPPDLDKK